MPDLNDQFRAKNLVAFSSKPARGIGAELVRLNSTQIGMALDGQVINIVSSDADVFSDADVPKSVAKASADRAAAAVLAQQYARTPYTGCTVSVDNEASTTWDGAHAISGTYTAPVDPHPALPYTPVTITAPLNFPIVADAAVRFEGIVDAPFGSMEGFAGREYTSPGVPNPATMWADDGNWGTYYVRATCNGSLVFRAEVAANRTWYATVADAPYGDWEFQLCTYHNSADQIADANRVDVGNPWKSSERTGDVRQYWSDGACLSNESTISSVAITRGGTNQIVCTVALFDENPGCTYYILVTEETDTEYAYKLYLISNGGTYTITSTNPLNGKVTLRVVETVDGASQAVVGGAWNENIGEVGVYRNLGIELRVDGVALPEFVVGASTGFTWSGTAPGGYCRVRLFDATTKRVYGQWSLRSGLVRSYNVPADQVAQTPASGVYYDAFNDTCFIYDQALALITYMQRGEEEPAVRLVNALLEIQEVDGSWSFAYDMNMAAPAVLIQRNGAIAWLVYALLLADRPGVRDWFPTKTTVAAKAGLAYLVGYINALGLVNGGKGTDADPNYVIPWWSTEHNIDAWWAFTLAAELYGNTPVNYQSFANAIKAALLTNGVGWYPTKDIFWQGGTVTAGVNTPDGQHALDTHTWGSVILRKWGKNDLARTSMLRCTDKYFTTDAATLKSGYTAYISEDGYPSAVVTPWYEGSFGAAVALQDYDMSLTFELMYTLAQAQETTGLYPYQQQADPSTGASAFPSLVSAAWNVLAYTGAGTGYTRAFWI